MGGPTVLLKLRRKAVRYVFSITVHSLEPWPLDEVPVSVHYERGSKKTRRGTTRAVYPTKDPSGPDAHGRLVFDETIQLPATLFQNGRGKGPYLGPYEKKIMKLSAVEKDQSGGYIVALLGNVELDLAKHAGPQSTAELDLPLRCVGQFKAVAAERPVLKITLQCWYKGACGPGSISTISSPVHDSSRAFSGPLLEMNGSAELADPRTEDEDTIPGRMTKEQVLNLSGFAAGIKLVAQENDEPEVISVRSPRDSDNPRRISTEKDLNGFSSDNKMEEQDTHSAGAHAELSQGDPEDSGKENTPQSPFSDSGTLSSEDRSVKDNGMKVISERDMNKENKGADSNGDAMADVGSVRVDKPKKRLVATITNLVQASYKFRGAGVDKAKIVPVQSEQRNQSKEMVSNISDSADSLKGAAQPVAKAPAITEMFFLEDEEFEKARTKYIVRDMAKPNADKNTDKPSVTEPNAPTAGKMKACKAPDVTTLQAIPEGEDKEVAPVKGPKLFVPSEPWLMQVFSALVCCPVPGRPEDDN